MPKNSDQFSMQDAKRLANSEAGQQLLALLKSQNSGQLQQAMEQAAAGDYAQVKQTLSTLLESEQVRELLRRLGG